jgi:hypothetical protein
MWMCLLMSQVRFYRWSFPLAYGLIAFAKEICPRFSFVLTVRSARLWGA